MDVGNSEESSEIRLVIFGLGDREYAIAISSVVEIIYYREPTSIPESGRSIEGIVDLRGTIIPLVDLRKRFGVNASRKPEHIVVVQLASKEIGLIVDRVSEVFSVSTSELHSAQEILDHQSPVIRAVCKIQDRLVLLVDLGYLWSSSELTGIHEAAQAAK